MNLKPIVNIHLSIADRSLDVSSGSFVSLALWASSSSSFRFRGLCMVGDVNQLFDLFQTIRVEYEMKTKVTVMKV